MSFRTRALLFWQGYALIGTLVFQPAAWADLAGGIATDGTMGAAQALSGVNVTVPQTLGTTVGNNLFHSFSEFNIAPGQTVDFTGSNALQNVISRVTGSNPSDIEGTLKSSIANAAFYFINPNGITFGADAQVDVPGAFHVSTADKIDFPNNSGAFYAGKQPASTLSSEAPAAFGFLDTSTVNNGLIAVDGAQLAVKTGQTLDMVAGEIDIKNYANVNASAGEIRLAALQGFGLVGLQQTVDGVLPLPAYQPSAGNAGRIAVDSSSVGASGDGGGRISLWGGNTSLVNNAAIYVDNEGDADATSAKGIDIRSYALSIDKSLVAFDAYWGTGKAGSVSVASQDIDIFNEGAISSNSFSGGDAGKVQVVADMLRIDGQGSNKLTGIASDAKEGSSGNAGSVAVFAKNLEILNLGWISSGTSSTGDAGNVNVQAGTLDIVNGGTISSNTLSFGNAGSVQVSADTLRIDGQGVNSQTGIASDAGKDSTGNAGAVSVSANNLEIHSLGTISSDTWSTGDAGAVKVVADKLRIDGQGNTEAATGIFTGVYSEEQQSGHAGDLSVQAGTLDIVNGGTISSDTWSSGNAGVVQIIADTLRIDGQGGNKQTGITSDAVKGSSANAGAVSVSAKNLGIFKGGLISSSTFSVGNAGSVMVTADSLTIDSHGGTALATGILSQAERGSSGQAGNVAIQAGTLDVMNGGDIASSTFAEGNAGNVMVTADALTIDSQGFLLWATGILSQAEHDSSGQAGNVIIQAGALNIMNGGSIASSTFSKGDAGGVIASVKNLGIENGGRISSNTSSRGDAGAVVIEADMLRIDDQGGSGQTGIGSDAVEGSSGNAGGVIIKAKNLDIVNGGTISSDTRSSGDAGAIAVEADTLRIDGQGGSGQTGIASDAVKGSTGNAGGVIVSAKNLEILNLGSISSDTRSSGDAGIVKVAADKLRIDGQGNTEAATGIFTGVYSTEPHSGNAGDLSVQAGTLDIVNGGLISSSTFSSGHAGGVLVVADTLRIDGQGGSGQTGIASDAAQGSSGDSGGVAVSAKSLEILNTGSVSSNTWSTGDAGIVEVIADKLRIDGQDNTEAATGIFSAVYSSELHSGNGGDLTVRAGTLDILKGGAISSSTSSEGKAGQVFVEADTLNIDSQGFSSWATGISAEAVDTSGGQTGNVLVNASSIVRLLDGGKISIENTASPDNAAAIIPGSITITAPDIVMKGSGISSTSTGNVAAGNIVLNFSHWLTMEPSFISTMANTGNGGSITVNGGQAIYLENSGFSTTVSGADSNGGDITTKADILAMNNGVIQANAVGGSGGNINLNLKSLIPSGNTLIKGGPAVDWQPFEAGFNVIQAASQAGVNGEVNVTAPQLNLSGIIANLGGPQFETGIIAQDYCGVGTGSSLTRKGAGGVKPKSGDQVPF